MSIGFYPCFLDKLFLLNEIMHFQSSSLCFYYALTHHFPLSGTLKANLSQQHIHLTLRMNVEL
jgi:hypothetical protein